jgi:pyruvate dehydrogenase E1 component alpha subunit
LNLAALWKLPVLFICENNTAEVSRTPGQAGYHAPNLSIIEVTDLAKSMGLATTIIDGSDLGTVWNTAKAARTRAISGGGATFMEVRTETWPGGQWPTLVTGHTDISNAWTAEVPKQYAHLSAWFQRNDPVLSVARELLALGIVSRQDLGKIDTAVKSEIDEAVTFANESPFPKPETALADVWPQ